METPTTVKEFAAQYGHNFEAIKTDLLEKGYFLAFRARLSVKKFGSSDTYDISDHRNQVFLTLPLE